ncbi:MAG: hypothetical protein AAF694_06925 [Bacteroidota bacterium]
MKHLLFSLILVACCSCASTDLLVKIPPQQSIEIDLPAYERYDATLRNQSLNDVEVKVLNKSTDEALRGFGLAGKGKATVFVEKSGKLVLNNPTDSPKGVKISIIETEVPQVDPNRKAITFTLANNTAKSIPLIIPTVMNPNLSPFSKSGVDLKIGQEIIFRAKGKKHVLLVVDQTIEDGEVIDVAKLLKERKKELGLN